MNGFFARWLTEVELVSGAGSLWYLRLGQQAERLLDWGHEPVPYDHNRPNLFVFHDGPPRQGTYIFDLLTRRHERVSGALGLLELVEKAGGGGLWAGVQRPENIIHFSDGRAPIPNAGQPAIGPDRGLVYREGDSRIEPSRCRGAEAWGQEGRILGRRLPDGAIVDLTVAGPEYRPRLIDLPNGHVALETMTNTTLRLRLWGDAKGWEKRTGADQNWHSAPIFQSSKGIIAVAYCNDRGALFVWEQSLSEEPKAFSSGDPTLPVPPLPPAEPPKEPPVSSNHLDIVQQVDREFPHLLQINTIASCTEFTQRVLARLGAAWGHVGKTAGERQGVPVPVGFVPRTVNGHHITGVSYDAIFNLDANLQVDIIGNGTANEPGPWPKGPGSPIWNEIAREHYRANNPWIERVPVSGEQPKSEPPPNTPPPSSDALAALQRQFEIYRQETEVKIAQLEQRLQKRVAFKSAHGRYVCAEPDGRLVANRERVGGWELFEREYER